jgi:hypothetical protein
MDDRRPTSWASEDEYNEWFALAVESGRIDWPGIAYKRPYTTVADEFGRELPDPIP